MVLLKLICFVVINSGFFLLYGSEKSSGSEESFSFDYVAQTSESKEGEGALIAALRTSSRTHSRINPVCSAILNEDMNAMHTLLAQRRYSINAANVDGETPLFFAVLKGNVLILNKVLTYAPYPFAPNILRVTALEKAWLYLRQAQSVRERRERLAVAQRLEHYQMHEYVPLGSQ